MTNQPKIPIKKSDGTIEYVDLVEFKKRRDLALKSDNKFKPNIPDLTIPEIKPAPIMKQLDNFKKEDSDSLLSEPVLEKLADHTQPIKPQIKNQMKTELVKDNHNKTPDVFVEQRSSSQELGNISQLLKNKYRPRNEKASPIFSPTKKIFQDVSPAVSSGVGPIDEIKSYTLLEFRRLSDNPDEAMTRFKQKFLNLKEESFIFFMKSLYAWRESKLYYSYIDKVVEALNKNVELKSLLNGESDIKMKEIELILQMEKELI